MHAGARGRKHINHPSSDQYLHTAHKTPDFKLASIISLEQQLPLQLKLAAGSTLL